MKGCAPSLALTTRHNVTQKWPIEIAVCYSILKDFKGGFLCNNGFSWKELF